jgi:hypothetical protein
MKYLKAWMLAVAGIEIHASPLDGISSSTHQPLLQSESSGANISQIILFLRRFLDRIYKMNRITSIHESGGDGFM